MPRHSEWLWLQELRPYCFYALVDPRDGAVRYVGRTEHRRNRLASHRKNRQGLACKRAWVEELARLGMAPRMVTLEESDQTWQGAKRREAELILREKLAGAVLLNAEALRGR